MNLLSRSQRISTMATAFRRDGYENTLSGLTGARSNANVFAAGPLLTEAQLKDLFDGNWLARRIVEALPDAVLRKPLVIDKTKIVEYERLNNDNRFPGGVLKHGLGMGRLCGGAVIVLGVKGSGSPLEQPLPVNDDGTIKNGGELAFLDVVTRFDLNSEKRYDVPDDPTLHKRTEVFKVKNGRLKDLLIHESRMIFCEGVAKTKLTDSQEDRDFPWESCLQPINEILGSYGISWTAVSHLIQESSISWLKMRGLTDMLASEDKTAVDERMTLMSTGRNVSKTVFLEAGDGDGEGEEYGRTDVSFNGLPDLMRELTLQVCGGSRIPYVVLMGDTPAGLNATGEMDLTQWYDTCEEYRTTSVRPKQVRLFSATNVTVEWSFAPLWEPTAAQRAEIRKKNLDGDQLLFTMSVIEPEHILESRGNDGTLGLTIDHKKILAERAAAKVSKSVELTPTDNAKGFTFNEIRLQQGKPPINIPGTNTPDPDGDLPAFLYEFKKTEEIKAQIAATTNAQNGARAPGAEGQNPQDGRPVPADVNPQPGGGSLPDDRSAGG